MKKQLFFYNLSKVDFYKKNEKKQLKIISTIKNKMGYIYFITEREFLKTNENIHKIVMSKSFSPNNYKIIPSESIIHTCIMCNDPKFIQSRIIKFFSEKYTRRLDIGNEYFEGPVDKMKYEVASIVIDNDNKTKEEIIDIYRSERF